MWGASYSPEPSPNDFREQLHVVGDNNLNAQKKRIPVEIFSTVEK